MSGGIGGGFGGMDGFLGMLFEGAGRLGSRAARQNQHVVDQQLSDLIAGRQISANEILARQRAAGNIFPTLTPEQQSEGMQSQLLEAAAMGQLHIQEGSAGRLAASMLVQPNMFTRWLDIRDSEDELQEFLTRCVHYGARYRTIEPMTMERLEKDDE